MSIAPSPALAPLYYLDNFSAALAWVSERYADLLDYRELGFIEAFENLPTPSQGLLVRLIMRKGRHFRASKLIYAEIGDIGRVAAPLRALGWLHTEAKIDLTTLFGLLHKNEILAHVPSTAPFRACAKSVMLQALSATHTGEKQLALWCPTLSDTLYSLTVHELCDRLRLMFFGNLSQTWAEFVLADLGIFRYESVDIAPESRGFQCRQDVDDYLHLHTCREAFESGTPITEVRQLVGEFASQNPYLQVRHSKLIFSMARQLERDESLELALQLYAECDYNGTRQRCIRILEKLARHQEAYALARAAQARPESDSELLLVERALVRLERKRGNSISRQQAPQQARRLDLLLPRPEHGSVERAVCEHFSAAQSPVYYVENTLVCSLFGLLCWEAIFAPVPGAFFHPFHSGPMDLHSSEFHGRRRALFDRCLGRLEAGTYRQVIRETYAAKMGIQSPFVHWGTGEELLNQALLCIPAEHLQHWFRRLLLDIRGNRTGMPDLIQFWPEEQRYRMIEVKGPGDRLQDNQRRWIAFCSQHGMPVEVCHVRWADI